MQQKSFIKSMPVKLAALLLLVLANAAVMFAQLNTTKVEGTVRDKDTGKPLQGAQVTAFRPFSEMIPVGNN